MAHTWGPERASDLAALVGAALPDERLSADELLACCWDDPGVVLASDDGQGACAVVTRTVGSATVGWIRLLVVHPGARRQGVARALVADAERWCRQRGADTLRFGGSAPWYLWPGLDVSWTAGLCLAEACGYRPDGVAYNLSCPTTFRAPAPPGVELRRVVTDDDEAAVRGWCRRHWPHWDAELGRAVEQGGAVGAFLTGPQSGSSTAAAGTTIDADADPASAVVGFACHSVLRAAWVGPMATRPTVPGDGTHVPGTGAALLGFVCRDLMVAGYADAEVGWVSNVSFYARTAGATVSRVFQEVVRDLAAPRAAPATPPG